jgi:hypothetical protein
MAVEEQSVEEKPVEEQPVEEKPSVAFEMVEMESGKQRLSVMTARRKLVSAVSLVHPSLVTSAMWTSQVKRTSWIRQPLNASRSSVSASWIQYP